MIHVQRLGAALAALSLWLCGCGAEEQPQQAPGAAPSEGSSDTASSSSAPADPSVPAANGRPMRLPGAAARAPEGWTVESMEVADGWIAHDPEAYWGIYFSQVKGNVTSLEELIDVGVLSSFRGKPTVSYDAELGGQPALRARGKDSLGRYVLYGAVLDGPAALDSIGVTLAFGPDESITAKEQRRIEESVLASFEWR